MTLTNLVAFDARAMSEFLDRLTCDALVQSSSKCLIWDTPITSKELKRAAFPFLLSIKIMLTESIIILLDLIFPTRTVMSSGIARRHSSSIESYPTSNLNFTLFVIALTIESLHCERNLTPHVSKDAFMEALQPAIRSFTFKNADFAFRTVYLFSSHPTGL